MDRANMGKYENIVLEPATEVLCKTTAKENNEWFHEEYYQRGTLNKKSAYS